MILYKHSKFFSLGVLVLSTALNNTAFADYTIVDRGAFHRVWRDSGTGGQYTELENGLHFWNRQTGQWVESRDLIEITPEGAAALHGPTTVRFKPNANSPGAIELVTQSGKRFRSAVIGLYYFDAASGKSVQLAGLKDSIGVLYSPNQIVYPEAFDGDLVRGDLHYIYTKNAFEQNIVLLSSPPPPGAFGLDEATTRFEVWTEFIGLPAIKINRVILKKQTNIQPMVEPDLTDDISDFGDGFFPVGNAFEFNRPVPLGVAAGIKLADPSDPATIPVGKKWKNIKGRTILIESVDFSDLAPNLLNLAGAGRAGIKAGAHQVRVERTLPEEISRENIGVIQLAQNSYSPKGFVIDYTTLPSSASSYTFTADATYYIPTSFYVGSGTVTFANRTTIKYGNNAWFLCYGSLAYQSGATNIVFTSKDDNQSGEPIDGSSGNPTYAAAQALWIYFLTINTTFKDSVIRWAKRGLQYDSNASCTETHTVQNSTFRNSQTTIYISNASVSLSSVNKCSVIGISNNGGCLSGSMSDECPDIAFDSAWMATDEQKPEVVVYTPSSCDLSTGEGTVGGSGEARNILRFGIKLKNIGTGAFWGERDHNRRMKPWKNNQNCHNHCHLTDWLKFELLNASGVVGAGKLGWNLYDWSFFCTDASIFFPAPAQMADCVTTEMGLNVNKCDEYGRGTLGQWLDVNDVQPGTYTLRITVNKDNLRYEGNYGNNVRDVTVTIP